MEDFESNGAESARRKEFDELLGGETSLPTTITPRDFINARINEVEALTEAIENPQRTAMVFQKLPKKMRRRVMSHNAKRMPNCLKQAHTHMLEKCSAKEVGKRPSRKYRRRPSNLRDEYTRRQKSNVWLETHIWHAKRFHMVNKWGYRLADFPNDKSFKACYRASAQHCLLQDVSFLSCLELSGPVEEIVTGLSKLSSDSFKRKSDLSGHREGAANFSSITGEPIGQVSFLWSSGDELSNMKQLWLWVHPAFVSKILEQLEKIFSSHAVIIINLTPQLLRFRLTGPKSLEVLSGALHPVNESEFCSWISDSGYYQDPNRMDHLHIQTEYLRKFLLTTDPGQLPPRSILPALVTTHLPKLPQTIRQKEVDTEVILIDPVKHVSSPLWNDKVRKAMSASNQREKGSNSETESNLVSSVTPLIIEKSPASVLLVHRPGRQDTIRQGYGCGVDVICPSGWGMRFWLCLVHNGARAAGLRDFDIVETDTSLKPKFILNSEASTEHLSTLNSNNREKYFRLPPAKRPNFQKLGVSNPFDIPWKKLQQEWGSDELVRVYLVSHGKLTSGSQIYLPISSDIEHKDSPPAEPQHPDPNKNKRSEIKLKHKQTLRILAKLRKKLRSKAASKNELPSSKEIVEKHRSEMEALWLGEVDSVRTSNIRETMGFITEGNYSLLQGKCAGYGYVSLVALKSLRETQGNSSYLVLTRNNNSLHYIFADLKTV